LKTGSPPAVCLESSEHRRISLPDNREYPERPLIGVGAIIVDDGEVVLIKRGHPPLEGEWSIPGGVLEVGETMREGVIREAREETGLVVEPLELLGVYDRVQRDERGQVLYHYVLVDFLCLPVAGELKAAGDAADAGWFSPEDAAGLSLPPDTREVLRLGFEKSAR
jgi:ADP-ribose pyrophosphatase YjhB (NUDIX family)